MKRYLAVGVLILGWACAPPQTNQPSEINISNQNTNSNGGGSGASPGTCSNVDSVTQSVPPSFNHGTPVAISLSATLGGSNVPLGQACGAAAWLVGVPCVVANVGAAKTTLDASAVDLSGCSVQGCIGSVCASAQTVIVN